MKQKKLSNGYLDSLRRQAVKKRDGNKCILCFSTQDLEDHHIIHRRQCWSLRWDMENGVTLCKKCHNVADTLYFRKLISEKIDINYLADMQLKYPIKADYLISMNMTEAEARQDFADKLKCFIKEGE